jgi:hypothetical protein
VHDFPSSGWNFIGAVDGFCCTANSDVAVMVFSNFGKDAKCISRSGNSINRAWLVATFELPAWESVKKRTVLLRPGNRLG